MLMLTPDSDASTGEDSLAGDSYGVDSWHGDLSTTHHRVTLFSVCKVYGQIGGSPHCCTKLILAACLAGKSYWLQKAQAF